LRVAGGRKGNNMRLSACASHADRSAALRSVWVFVIGGLLLATGADFASAQCQTEELVKLLASDSEGYDRFGCSVALDGDVAVIGTSSDNIGSAYVFRFDGSDWMEETELRPSDAGNGDHLGRSVAVDGDTILIGAYGCDDACPSDPYCNSGAAYIFRFNSEDWIEEARLTALDAAEGDNFGFSVSISGNVAVIGAHGDDDTKGSAYVFRFNGSNWVQEAKLTASDAAEEDNFGFSVSVSGDAALVGAQTNDDACPADPSCNSGSAYVFRFNGSNWVQEAKLLASDAAEEDLFGKSVALSGSRALVGALGANAMGSDSGAAYVFRFNGSSWGDEDKLLASDGGPFSWFGDKVSISGTTAVIGSYGDDPEAACWAYVFRLGGITRTQEVAKLIPSDGAFCWHYPPNVAVSGATAITGIPEYEQEPHYLMGAAYVFGSLDDCDNNFSLDICDIVECPGDPACEDCNVNGIPDQCDIDDGTSQDANGNGIPDECDLPGDMNCDWSVDGLDIDGFVLALIDEAAYDGAYPNCYRLRADCNGDDEIDTLDVESFVTLLIEH